MREKLRSPREPVIRRLKLGRGKVGTAFDAMFKFIESHEPVRLELIGHSRLRFENPKKVRTDRLIVEFANPRPPLGISTKPIAGLKRAPRRSDDRRRGA